MTGNSRLTGVFGALERSSATFALPGLGAAGLVLYLDSITGHNLKPVVQIVEFLLGGTLAGGVLGDAIHGYTHSKAAEGARNTLDPDPGEYFRLRTEDRRIINRGLKRGAYIGFMFGATATLVSAATLMHNAGEAYQRNFPVEQSQRTPKTPAIIKLPAAPNPGISNG